MPLVYRFELKANLLIFDQAPPKED
ncbi:MAG: hypothetical protein RLZZ258_192, partial [Actinomycetota bacterium]